MIDKLNKIQRELKAPKNQFNAFGKYKYRSQEDILEAVKPMLDGLVLTLTDDIKIVGDRIYVVATAIITDGTKEIKTTALAREPIAQKGMSESQVTVSASSYARKTALNGLFCLDDTKDTDTQDHTQSPTNEINRLIKAKKVDLVEFLKYFKKNAVSELNYDEQHKALQMLQAKK